MSNAPEKRPGVSAGQELAALVLVAVVLAGPYFIWHPAWEQARDPAYVGLRQ